MEYKKKLDHLNLENLATVLFDAQKSLLDLLQGKEDAIKKANDTFDELHKLFEYVDKVLMDGNISKETIRRLDPTIKIPD